MTAEQVRTLPGEPHQTTDRRRDPTMTAYSAIYHAIVVYKVNQDVIAIDGFYSGTSPATEGALKQRMIETLLRDDMPQLDPNEVRIADFVWTGMDPVDEPVISEGTESP